MDPRRYNVGKSRGARTIVRMIKENDKIASRSNAVKEQRTVEAVSQWHAHQAAHPLARKEQKRQTEL